MRVVFERIKIDDDLLRQAYAELTGKVIKVSIWWKVY